MNISICSIATGDYFERFTKLRYSLEKYFLKTHNVSIYVFSNKVSNTKNTFFINHLPSPLVPLMKFHYIISKGDYFLDSDLIYCIDSDCEVVENIDDEIIPNLNGLVCVEHPWQKYNSPIYEDNPLSKAFVEDSGNNHYFQSSFFGGYTDAMLTMCKFINELISQDLKNRYIAKWFDESYFNKYMIGIEKKKILNCGYSYPTPSMWNQTFDVIPKIIHDNAFSL